MEIEVKYLLILVAFTVFVKLFLKLIFKDIQVGNILNWQNMLYK